MTSAGIHFDKHTKANKDSLQNTVIGPQGGINTTSQCASLRQETGITVVSLHYVVTKESPCTLNSDSVALTLCLH